MLHVGTFIFFSCCNQLPCIWRPKQHCRVISWPAGEKSRSCIQRADRRATLQPGDQATSSLIQGIVLEVIPRLGSLLTWGLACPRVVPRVSHISRMDSLVHPVTFPSVTSFLLPAWEKVFVLIWLFWLDSVYSDNPEYSILKFIILIIAVAITFNLSQNNTHRKSHKASAASPNQQHEPCLRTRH